MRAKRVRAGTAAQAGRRPFQKAQMKMMNFALDFEGGSQQKILSIWMAKWNPIHKNDFGCKTNKWRGDWMDAQRRMNVA
jgi:hypothetical protein